MTDKTKENYDTIKNDQSDNSPSKEIKTYVDTIFNSTNIIAWGNINV